MKDDVQAGAPEAEAPAAEPETPPRRRWWRRLGTGVRRVLMFTAILLAVALVTTITVDLGPAVRGMAERAGSSYLKRDLTIGRLSIRLLNGAFVVENLRIGGLQAADRPFLTARTGLDESPLSTLCAHAGSTKKMSSKKVIVIGNKRRCADDLNTTRLFISLPPHFYGDDGDGCRSRMTSANDVPDVIDEGGER